MPVLPSRFASAVVVTFPLNYVSPSLSANIKASPDATATGDGLAIQGTNGRLYAGTQDPNTRIKASMGSVFMRVGSTVEYSAYLKEADDGGSTGWFPLATLGGKASVGNTFTFGLTDDTVGLNAALHYGNVLQPSYLQGGAVSVVGLPTTADMILDVKYSADAGATWFSVFPPGNDDTGDVAFQLQKIIFPKPASLLIFNPLQILFNRFNQVVIPSPSLLRIDCLQSGGATGIVVTLTLGPIPPVFAPLPGIAPLLG